jgi:hypothetical protein
MFERTLPAGFIAPCLPIKTTKLPAGGKWMHEIKHIEMSECGAKKLCATLILKRAPFGSNHEDYA